MDLHGKRIIALAAVFIFCSSCSDFLYRRKTPPPEREITERDLTQPASPDNQSARQENPGSPPQWAEPLPPQGESDMGAEGSSGEHKPRRFIFRGRGDGSGGSEPTIQEADDLEPSSPTY